MFKNFKKLKQNKKKLNLISSLQILRNVIIFLILMNFWMQLNNHMILQLDQMKYIIKCLNISQRVPSKLCYVYLIIYGLLVIFLKIGD